MATHQVSAGLTAPRIFQQKSVKANKALQSFGPLHRSVSRPNNFAYNPALDSSEVTTPFKFVRPDCPPDVAEAGVNGKSQKSTGSQRASQQVNNTARSALEQVKQVELLMLSVSLLVFASFIFPMSAGQFLHQHQATRGEAQQWPLWNFWLLSSESDSCFAKPQPWLSKQQF